jgi:hypothetical protein
VAKATECWQTVTARLKACPFKAEVAKHKLQNRMCEAEVANRGYEADSAKQNLQTELSAKLDRTKQKQESLKRIVIKDLRTRYA